MRTAMQAAAFSGKDISGWHEFGDVHLILTSG
jgi:hypothetical protein